jgi:hypothetical protein
MSHDDDLPDPPQSHVYAICAVAACVTGVIGAVVGDVLFGLAGGIAGFVAVGAAGYLTAMLLNLGTAYILKHEREIVRGVIVCVVTMLILEALVHYWRNGD